MSGTDLDLKSLPPDTPPGDEDNDSQKLLSVDTSPPGNTSPVDKYLTDPPENWKSSTKFPRSLSDCMFHWIGKLLGGRFTHEPEDMLCGDSPMLSESTQRILRERVFHDLDPREVLDYHVHIVGHGDSGSKCFINDNMKTWWKPYNRIKSIIFMAASQVPDMIGGDVQYISRLIRLVKHFVPASILGYTQSGEQYRHGKCCLLSFDAYYDKHTCRENRQKTTFYIPNDYCFKLAQEHPQYFYPVGSVNPYRRDALEELERCAANGVSIIKWLPNSMGINLRDEQCVPFYRKLRELDMALLVHVGEEHAVDAAFLDNNLGNPLYLRQPLKFGVKVVAAHCGTEGYAVDIEEGGVRRSCFELFLRLMKTPAYEGKLFGDISAVCGFKRVDHLRRLMEETTIHDRLVYGSDYPVPAINLVVHTSKLQRVGLITAEEKDALNELYDYNPLLFDLASKRLLKSSEGKSFPTSVFRKNPLLPPIRTTPYNIGTGLDCGVEDGAPTEHYTEHPERPPTPEEAVRHILVEVEVYDSGQEEGAPDDGGMSSEVITNRTDEEVEESNEETKLLASQNS